LIKYELLALTLFSSIHANGNSASHHSGQTAQSIDPTMVITHSPTQP